MKVIPFSRNHRTALVLDVRRGIDSTFEERAKRLLESVNGPNIKCDIFTLTGPEATLTQGTTLPSAATVAASATEVTLSKGSPFALEAEQAVVTGGDITAELDGALSAKGYVQILHVRNLGAI